MTSRRSLWATWLTLGSTLLLASCSTGRDGDKAGALTPKSQGQAGAQGDPWDEESGLVANVVSISASGELCPPPANGDWSADLTRANYGFVQMNFPRHAVGCSDPFRAGGQRCSLDPKCTVTMEVEVPAGTRMGVPTITWLGAAGGEDRGTFERSYVFAGGERAAMREEALPDGDIHLQDSGVAAFSATCNGTSRVRLTAELVAHRTSADVSVEIDAFVVTPSERFGTVFKSCASGEAVGSAGTAGDWCQGKSHRPCEKGLICEFAQPPASFGQGSSSNVDMSTAQGQCTDPRATLPTSGFEGPCGGVTNMGCWQENEDLVCWHVPNTQPNWRGICLRRQGRGAAPCTQGTPSLGCAAGYVCESSSHSCKLSRGLLGDACGKPDLAPCSSPLFCRTDVCEQAQGVQGDPCGSSAYPACKSPGMCVDGHCQSDKAGLNQACNAERTCRKGMICVDTRCTPDPTPRSQP